MTTNPDEEPNHLSQLMMEGLRYRRHHAAAEASSGAGKIYRNKKWKETKQQPSRASY